MLAAIFNLVRNGQAHQYQQMRAVLSDKSEFCVQLTGAQHGLEIASGTIDRRGHLACCVTGAEIWVRVRPDVLFVDLRDAIRSAQLEHRGLTLQHIVEDRPETFAFDQSTLARVLSRF
ncbi:MAG: hypothetical protein JW940_12680 [Polyangiaceae bacterium]|nr:hypothetical protein [Polyangiaceae bacterium]